MIARRKGWLVGQPEGARVQSRAAFYTSRLLGQAGQTLLLVALFMISGARHSAMELSAAFVAMMAAAVLFGLPAGAVADWMGARRAFVTGAALRAIAIVSAFLVIDRPEWVWAVVFLYSAVSQLFSPAELALVGVVHRSRPGITHTALVLLQYAGQAAGLLALAPLLHLVGGLSMMLAGAAVLQSTATVSALYCVARAGTGEATPIRASRRAAFDLGTTFRFLASDVRAAYAVVLLAFCQLAVKALAITLPPYVADDLQLSIRELAVIAAVAGVGGMAGFFWTSRTLTLGVAPRALKVTLLLMVLSLLTLALLNGRFIASPGSGFEALEPLNLLRASSFAVPFSIAAALAISLTVAPIGARTILTETAPPEHQARVFATQAIVTDIVVMLPLLLSGLGTQFAGARVTLLVLAAVGLAMFLLLEHVMTRAGREAQATSAALP